MTGYINSSLPFGRPVQATDPQADPRLLAAAGNKVRARLAEDPAAQDRGAGKADLFVVPGFLTRRECKRLVKVIDRRIGPSPMFRDKEVDGFRTSSTHYFDRGDPDTIELERRIDGLLGLDHRFAEVTQGQRYLAGQQFKHHYDYFTVSEAYWQQERRRGGQRTWTAMVFLNDVEGGGATDFPELGLAVEPQLGTLLTWNNMDREGQPNPATLHAGTPVLAGSKYVITQWYRQNEWSLELR